MTPEDSKALLDTVRELLDSAFFSEPYDDHIYVYTHLDDDGFRYLFAQDAALVLRLRDLVARIDSTESGVGRASRRSAS